jgi:hypothetical protein
MHVLSSLPSSFNSATNSSLLQYCILLDLYSARTAHQHGSQQPGDRGLTQRFEKMRKVPRERPIHVIVDALDECPDTSGLQSSREEVFKRVEKWAGLHLSNLRLFIARHPEIDICDRVFVY